MKTYLFNQAGTLYTLAEVCGVPLFYPTCMCEITKVCTVCELVKPLSEYPKRTGPKISSVLLKQYRHECKTCNNQLQIAGRERRKSPEYIKPTLDNLPDRIPHCNRCGLTKTWEDFNKSKQTRSGYHAWCRTCVYADRVHMGPKLKEARTNKAINDTLSYLLTAARCRAKKKGEPFTITEAELVVPALCPILGVPLVFNTPYCPSLDRIDNSKGYVTGNVIVISKKANTMKSNASWEQLRTFCENAYKVYQPYFQ